MNNSIFTGPASLGVPKWMEKEEDVTVYIDLTAMKNPSEEAEQLIEK